MTPRTDSDAIGTVVVGYGLAGRAFHAPLIRRQPGLRLHGVVARDPKVRAEAVGDLGVQGYASLDEALDDPAIRLVVIATPHDSHADLAVRALVAGRDCVVDKVMALSAAEADRMIDARDRSGRMLSVFHNRRWDWDFLTVKSVLDRGLIGRPLLFESSVCRYASPRTWRGQLRSAGTILHDWGAHLIDQALRLGLGPCRRVAAWLTPAPWEGVDSGGHGRIVMDFDDALFQVETSRVCRLDRPRWWVVGTEGGLAKFGVDPQEEALRAGDLDAAEEPPAERAILRRSTETGEVVESAVETVRGSWDAYYANIADHLRGRAPLEVTAEQAREVVRVLDAAGVASAEHRSVEGPWGV
jgi:scyllo-inositol 2-dehydrogenase (NADP+)